MTPAEDVLTPLLADHVGAQVAGGCDDCDAYQTIDVSRAPVYLIRVHHDDTCPAFRRIDRSTQQPEVK